MIPKYRLFGKTFERDKMIYKKLEYGIKCTLKDEKQIVKNINNFLQNENNRNLHKSKILNEMSRFNYEYGYWQSALGKRSIEGPPQGTNIFDWYFDLFPNEDLDGKWKFNNDEIQFYLFPNEEWNFDNKEMQWILFIEYMQNQYEDGDLFLTKLVKAIGFEIKLLHKYKENEGRIGYINYDDEG